MVTVMVLVGGQRSGWAGERRRGACERQRWGVGDTVGQ
jgi:hypothetical protein